MLFVLLGCGAANSNYEKITGYNLSKPDAKFVLPEILQEISGLSCIDSNSFACIQDENGILFIYDATGNKIENQYTFNIDGDYEGISRVGDSLYVLRSDGVLFEILDYKSKSFRLNSYTTGIPASNNEGLCLDADSNRLLIACKGKIGKGSEYKDKRVIYGFDLATKTLSKEPVFDFDLQKIRDFAEKQKLKIPSKKKKGKSEPDIKFRTSAICIHPVTGKLFLLSASDHLLFIFDMHGKIEHIELLDSRLFNKAEGISFFENGDMLITNEGQDKKPSLLRFNYKGK